VQDLAIGWSRVLAIKLWFERVQLKREGKSPVVFENDI
jgi:hypothetical protein